MDDDYEFVVSGTAGPTVQAAFADFQLVVGPDRTVLRGRVRDSAALYDVLDRMRNLGLELLEVRQASPRAPALDDVSSPDAG